MIIVAGYETVFNSNEIEENNLPSVWGHRGGLYTTTGDFKPTLDGLQLRYFTQFGEKQFDYIKDATGVSKLGDRQATMGVIAHEFWA